MAKKTYARIRIEQLERAIGLHMAKGENETVQAFYRFARNAAIPINDDNVSRHCALIKAELSRRQPSAATPPVAREG